MIRLLLSLELTVWVVTGETLYSSRVSADPAHVQARDAELTLLIEPRTAIPSGGLVELTLPASGEVSFTSAALAAAPTCDMRGLSVPVVVVCVVEEVGGRQKITWTTNRDIAASSSVQFQAAAGFNNPATTEPSDSLEMRTYSDSTKGTILDQ